MASIQCRQGEIWPNTHTHGSVAEVRLCQVAGHSNATPSSTASAALSLKSLEQEIPAGRYAIGPEDFTRFYKVDKPTDGRWKGYTFVKQVTGANTEGMRLLPNQRADVLAGIVAAGVQESMLRYGKEIGECGHCGRTLTNPESRARGIGPICAGRMGW